MNKLVKGSIAGAVGIALLLGGAGTFALWNGTANVAAGSVASGTLTIASNNATAVWRDISPDKTASTIDISTFKIVPGDTIELTQSIKVTATGNNLRAVLTYDPASITTSTAADLALKNKLVYDLSTASGAANIVRDGTTNNYLVTPAAGESTVTVKLTITLPTTTGNTPEAGNLAQAGTVNLSALSFKLNQTR